MAIEFRCNPISKPFYSKTIEILFFKKDRKYNSTVILWIQFCCQNFPRLHHGMSKAMWKFPAVNIFLFKANVLLCNFLRLVQVVPYELFPWDSTSSICSTSFIAFYRGLIISFNKRKGNQEVILLGRTVSAAESSLFPRKLLGSPRGILRK